MLSEITKVAKFHSKKRRGDQSKIASELGYSRSHVSNVLNGRRFNSTITSAAYRTANRRLTNLQVVSRLQAEVASLEG